MTTYRLSNHDRELKFLHAHACGRSRDGYDSRKFLYDTIANLSPICTAGYQITFEVSAWMRNYNICIYVKYELIKVLNVVLIICSITLYLAMNLFSFPVA